MKTFVRGALLLLIVCSSAISIGSARTLAQGAFPAYTSGVQVANLEAADAQVTLTGYNHDGTVNGAPLNDTIPANSAKTYFPISNISSGFAGSIVVAADKKVAAISNFLSANFSAGGAYVGREAGSTAVHLPLLNKGNNGFNTWFSVQNVGTVEASVTISYSDGITATATIKPGAAHDFYQTQEKHTLKNFAGTATSTQPLVVAVIQESTDIIFAYTGFTGSGSPQPVFPLVNANNAGYQTGLQIQNAGTTATQVTIAYTPSGADTGTPCTETQTAQPGGSATFALAAFSTSPNPAGVTSNCIKGAKFVGSAKVTVNSTNQPLVGIGNQWLPGRNGEAYGAFDPTNDATNKVVMPLIMDRNSGFFTGFNIQNVGTTVATVSCTFTNSNRTLSATLQPDQALTDLQGGLLVNKYVGSATCTAAETNAKLVGVVNELGPSTTADQLLVYEGITIIR